MVSCVIFDEIHYMHDQERGVIWEEVLILCSKKKINFIFLSATIPNSLEFALWIAKLTDQICHVIYTEQRPVPLCHYIFSEKKLYKIIDTKGKFQEELYK